MLRDANVEVDQVDDALVGHGVEDGEVGTVEGEAEAGGDVVQQLARRTLLGAA
jgi:hypothetical protein